MSLGGTTANARTTAAAVGLTRPLEPEIVSLVRVLKPVTTTQEIKKRQDIIVILNYLIKKIKTITMAIATRKRAAGVVAPPPPVPEAVSAQTETPPQSELPPPSPPTTPTAIQNQNKNTAPTKTTTEPQPSDTINNLNELNQKISDLQAAEAAIKSIRGY